MHDASTPPRPKADLLVQGATEVLTVPAYGGLGIMSGAIVAIGGGRILGVGDRAGIERTVDLSTAAVVEVDGGVVAPGYVDAHTHVVFGGSRVDEYIAHVERDEVALEHLRSSGSTGILATVAATRAASLTDLVEQTAGRLRDMLEHGTTTVESKSGYGLTTTSEVKTLNANVELARVLPIRIVPTFLGAHAIPPEETREAYVQRVAGEMIDEVAGRGLALFCDVYCDQGYFSVDDTERILEAGQRAGLRSKIHLDAYSNTGGAALAARLGVTSVDHLNFTTPAEAERLAAAGVVGVVMPALDLAVAHEHPFDARTLLDAGLTLALATDICPGCWTTSMTLIIQLACRTYGLTIAEAIRAATFGGAAALGMADEIGSLEPGRRADLQVWALPDHRHLAYRLGTNPVSLVVIGGEIAVDRRPALADR
jgi:imidazolonepropionase